jgi:hypothetical protein
MPASQLCHLADVQHRRQCLAAAPAVRRRIAGELDLRYCRNLCGRECWVASAGMLVVGFLVSYLAIGGPRLAGISTGLLLMFILPSFPRTRLKPWIAGWLQLLSVRP